MLRGSCWAFKATSSKTALARLSTYALFGLNSSWLSLCAVGRAAGAGSTATVATVKELTSRSSVAVARTLTGPGVASVVSSVARLLPGVNRPPFELNRMVTGRLSGLVALQEMVEVSPTRTLLGDAVQFMVGALGAAAGAVSAGAAAAVGAGAASVSSISSTLSPTWMSSSAVM